MGVRASTSATPCCPARRCTRRRSTAPITIGRQPDHRQLPDLGRPVDQLHDAPAGPVLRRRLPAPRARAPDRRRAVRHRREAHGQRRWRRASTWPRPSPAKPYRLLGASTCRRWRASGRRSRARSRSSPTRRWMPTATSSPSPTPKGIERRLVANPVQFDEQPPVAHPGPAVRRAHRRPPARARAEPRTRSSS